MWHLWVRRAFHDSFHMVSNCSLPSYRNLMVRSLSWVSIHKRWGGSLHSYGPTSVKLLLKPELENEAFESWFSAQVIYWGKYSQQKIWNNGSSSERKEFRKAKMGTWIYFIHRLFWAGCFFFNVEKRHYTQEIKVSILYPSKVANDSQSILSHWNLIFQAFLQFRVALNINIIFPHSDARTFEMWSPIQPLLNDFLPQLDISNYPNSHLSCACQYCPYRDAAEVAGAHTL